MGPELGDSEMEEAASAKALRWGMSGMQEGHQRGQRGGSTVSWGGGARAEWET